MTRVCSDTITRLDKGDFALMAFLDLSVAFDTVDKSILINHLSRTFHIHGTVLEWFGSYLTGRTEYVLFKGVKSPARTAEYGIPRGSVLGLLLFVLYTADLGLTACRHGVKAHFYADDSQLYTVSQKKGATLAMAVTLSILHRFAKFIHCYKEH